MRDVVQRANDALHPAEEISSNDFKRKWIIYQP
jgi:hypothetical protein